MPPLFRFRLFSRRQVAFRHAMPTPPYCRRRDAAAMPADYAIFATPIAFTAAYAAVACRCFRRFHRHFADALIFSFSTPIIIFAMPLPPLSMRAPLMPMLRCYADAAMPFFRLMLPPLIAIFSLFSCRLYA